MKARKISTGVAQGLLSVSLLMAGVMKMITPYEELIAQMTWAENVSPIVVFLIGALEVLGVIGMNVPFLMKRYMKLIPIAAGGLALTMLGAVATHLFLGENIFAASILLLIAGFVTYSRIELFKKNDLQAPAH